MDKVVAEGHLVLLLGLVQITIVHLQDGILGIDLSVMVLLIDLDDLLQVLSFSKTKHLTPMGENFHSVEVGKLLLFNHGVS